MPSIHIRTMINKDFGGFLCDLYGQHNAKVSQNLA